MVPYEEDSVTRIIQDDIDEEVYSEIKGKTILENMIKFLNSGGINDITVVTGYKDELFDEYKEKLGFKKVVYKDYKNKNSSSSLKFVIDEIEKGTIILNGDLFINKSFIEYIKPNISQLLSQQITEGVISWGYIIDSNFKLIDIDTNAINGYGDGIAIFDNEEDLKILKKELINDGIKFSGKSMFDDLFNGIH